MSIIRGLRSISSGYARNFSNISDSEEEISGEICLITQDEDCSIKIANDWPENIFLRATINPVGFEKHPKISIQRIENGKNLGAVDIYGNPQFASNSFLKNSECICSEIVVAYDGAGESIIDGTKEKFHGTEFSDYSLELTDDVIFRKEFLTEKISNISEEYVVDKIHNVSVLKDKPDLVTFCLHPYGGYYKFGDHPQCIESCVFSSAIDSQKTVLKAWTLSKLRSIGIDPSKDQKLKDTTTLLGIKNFLPSQRINFLEEINSGNCKIAITNRNISETCRYKSIGLDHIPNTNIIIINFIKE